jgi:predicted dehydrogenase
LSAGGEGTLGIPESFYRKEKNMERVRIGIVGAQFAAHLHVQNYKPLRGSKVQIVAVASRTKAKAEEFAAQYQIPAVAEDYRRLLERKDIDVVDLCVPTDLHHEFIIEAAQAGKHVICEKPLTGYFGKERPEDLVGLSVDRETMLTRAMENSRAVIRAVKENKITFGYAENWIYAPPVMKLKKLMQASRGTILDMRAEESHSGSHAAYSRRWKTSGGGALMRLGAHPVAAVLHLKHFEGLMKQGRAIRVKSVTAEVGRHTRIESFKKEPQKFLVSAWEDVEDWATMIVNFDDGSQAVVTASDGVLGGIRNTMTVYLSNAVVQVNINPNDTVVAYAPAPQVFGEEYIAEKLETKAGWNFASPDEDWVRGYPQELEDFVDCLLTGREPVSGLDLAHQTVELIYAAYLAAEKGKRVELKEKNS